MQNRCGSTWTCVTGTVCLELPHSLRWFTSWFRYMQLGSNCYVAAVKHRSIAHLDMVTTRVPAPTSYDGHSSSQGVHQLCGTSGSAIKCPAAPGYAVSRSERLSVLPHCCGAAQACEGQGTSQTPLVKEAVISMRMPCHVVNMFQ